MHQPYYAFCFTWRRTVDVPQTMRKYANVSSLRIVAVINTSVLVFNANNSLKVETRGPIAFSSYVCAI